MHFLGGNLMKMVRLSAAIGGIVLVCLNVGRAEDEFVILGDASSPAKGGERLTQTAYQPPPAVPAAAEEPAPPPPGAAYQGPGPGPGPGGPIVIEEGWGDVWSQTCQPWCGLGAIFVGVEGTFLAPINEPNQSVVLTDLTTDQQFRGTSDSGLGAGMRTWLGIQQNGTGARVRYWFFGVDRTDFDPDGNAQAHPVFVESYYLRATTVDAELFHEFCFPQGHTLEASVGARYARLRRGSAVTGVGELGDIDLLGLAMGWNEMEGTGITASIGGTRPLHLGARKGCDPCCPAPCLNLFWNLRGSVLWADSNTSVLTDANANVNQQFATASASSRDQAFTSLECDTVFIADVQVGLEYKFGFCCVPGIFALRSGVEYQHWDLANLAAHSHSFAFLQDPGDPPAFGGQTDARANGNNGNLDLLGFFVGLEWQF
jgi:hypothetical protein